MRIYASSLIKTRNLANEIIISLLDLATMLTKSQFNAFCTVTTFYAFVYECLIHSKRVILTHTLQLIQNSKLFITTFYTLQSPRFINPG